MNLSRSMARNSIRLGLALLVLALIGRLGFTQNFRYEARPKAYEARAAYFEPEPAPRLLETAAPSGDRFAPPRENAYYPFYGPGGSVRRDSLAMAVYFGRPAKHEAKRAAWAEPIPAGQPSGPFVEDVPSGEMVGPMDGPLQDPALLGRPWEGRPPCQSCNDDDGESWLWHWCPLVERIHDRLAECYLFSPAVWQNFNQFGGAQAFKGPVDRGVNSNFGFYKGVNWASPFWDAKGIGFQLGGAIVLSDLEKSDGPISHRRAQYFVTTGLFRRADCNRGWQGGAVVDYLHDNFYVTMNLLQVRSELSYILGNGHEIGYWGAAHTKSDTQPAPANFQQSTVTWQANDQYNLFYRRRFCNGGIGRMWIGATSHADLIWGNDATAPLSERWAIEASYNYLLPRGDENVPRSIKESWNLSIALVWYPGYKVPNACYNPYRPLFSVADNGSFLITEKQ